MAWLDRINAKKKEELPEVFKGKSEDEILAAVKEAADLKKKNEELSSKVATQETQVQEIKTEFEQVKSRLLAAEANRNQPPQKKEDEREPANFVEEPDRAFGERAAPIANMAIQNSVMTSRILAQQQLDNMDLASNGQTMDGRLFRAWGAEIDAETKKYQPIQLTSPQAWLGIFYYLKGIHADELRDPEVRKKKYNFLETPSSTSSTTGRTDNGTSKTSSEQLTDQEKHVADKMGVSHDNYLKRKKSMQFVNA